MESTMEAKANVCKVDAVFPMIEDFISEKRLIEQRDKDGERGRKRKFTNEIPFAGNSKSVSIFTSEWREAVIRFAEKFPIDLLIREYNHYYCNIMICKDNRQFLGRESNQNDGQGRDLPVELLEEIFFRRPLHGLLASRSVCPGWDTVYSCRYFQDKYTSTEHCIVINNHNLDFWVFSVISKTWFLLKVPCDWDKMEAINSNTGLYVICFFGNFPGRGDDCVYLARYTSRSGIWTIKRIKWDIRNNYPLRSRNFPSRLSSYSNRGRISCFSATCGYFHCFTNGPASVSQNARYAFVRLSPHVNVPKTIKLEYRSGETCYNNVALPTVIPLLSDPTNSEVVWVGRMKRNDHGSQIYGRLPIVCHGDIGLWKFNQRTLQWSALDIITAVSMENMIKSSEGTDFLVVGDGVDNIWLMLRGSQNMVHYNLRTREWVMETGCPGGGYMDANFHGKAVFKVLKFDAQVNCQL